MITADDGRAVSEKYLAEKRARAEHTDNGAGRAAARQLDEPLPPEPPDDEPAELPAEPAPADEDTDQLNRRYLELLGQLLTVAGLRDIPPPEPLIDGYLFRDSLAWLSGKWGQGKSFVAIDLACSVATGTDWHGRPVNTAKVLYLVAEGASGMAQRIAAWEIHHGTAVINILFLPVPVQLMQNLDTAAFAMLLADVTPDLVVIDTQARCSVGAEENSSRDMGQLVDALETLRQQCHACFLVVHHEGRGGDHMRGSTALEGAATSILRVEKDGDQVTVHNPKQKDITEADPLELVLTECGDSAVLDRNHGFTTAMPESERKVLNLVAETHERGVTESDLKAAADLPKSTWHRAINNLLNTAKLRRVTAGRGKRYVLPAYDTQLTIDEQPGEDGESLAKKSHSPRGTPPQWTDEFHESHDEITGNPSPDQQESQSPMESQDPPGESHSPTPPIGGGTPLGPGDCGPTEQGRQSDGDTR